MKKLFSITILITLLHFGYSQPLDEQIRNIIGININELQNITVSVNNRLMLQTDYGKIIARTQISDNRLIQMLIKVENDEAIYKNVYEELEKIATIKIGNRRTDFEIEYNYIKTMYFKNYDEALKYYNEFAKSNITAYRGISIYKQPEKERYIVGKFIEEINEFDKEVVKDDEGLWKPGVNKQSFKKVVNEWVKIL